MIIVEGPDGAGKSTLIKNLGFERIRLKSIRGGVGGVLVDGKGDGLYGWGGTDHAVLAYSKQIVKAEGRNVAFDRFHLSEIVYGPLLRPEQRPELEIHDLLNLNHHIRVKHIPVILCLPPFQTTLQNVTKDGRERPTYQTEGFLHAAYVEFQRLAPWATIVYDFTRDALPQIVTGELV